MKTLKNYLVILCCSSLLLTCDREPVRSQQSYDCELTVPDPPPLIPGALNLAGIMQDLTTLAVPGAQWAITDADGQTWTGAAGVADVYNQVRLQPCHRTRVGSTVKIFTAVTCLLLQEEGLINLDDRVADYLSTEQLEGFRNIDEITLRQLLHHTSGLPNYITNPRFQTASLNELEKVWTPGELLAYSRDEPAEFPPGTDVRYSNTGYVLLGDVITQVAGKPFYEVFRERLFTPLGLAHTQFAATDPVPRDLVRGYVDLYANGELINATYYSGWDYFTADGGLISNAYDLSRFLHLLFGGTVLRSGSLTEMMEWLPDEIGDPETFPTDYGLGIFRITTPFGPAYIHSGDAIGYFASVAYFPGQEISLSWTVNANYGSLDEFTQSRSAMESIYQAVLMD